MKERMSIYVDARLKKRVEKDAENQSRSLNNYFERLIDKNTPPVDAVDRIHLEQGVSLDIAKRAWACCSEKEWLAKNYPEFKDIDPWDGSHEDVRRSLEKNAVKEVES